MGQNWSIVFRCVFQDIFQDPKILRQNINFTSKWSKNELHFVKCVSCVSQSQMRFESGLILLQGLWKNELNNLNSNNTIVLLYTVSLLWYKNEKRNFRLTLNFLFFYQYQLWYWFIKFPIRMTISNQGLF